IFDSILSFFFQAEDGIRDSSVTGVQTCALPISRVPAFPPAYGRSLPETRDSPRCARLSVGPAAQGWRPLPGGLSGVRAHAQGTRSEERRVGKEWRARWGGAAGRIEVEAGVVRGR